MNIDDTMWDYRLIERDGDSKSTGQEENSSELLG